jgi:hypothetical protein
MGSQAHGGRERWPVQQTDFDHRYTPDERMEQIARGAHQKQRGHRELEPTCNVPHIRTHSDRRETSGLAGSNKLCSAEIQEQHPESHLERERDGSDE